MRPPLFTIQHEPDHPGKRVQQGKRQGADQQRSHSPERPEQPRVAIAIVMRRVCQVARKPPVRALVALAAGLDDIVPAEH